MLDYLQGLFAMELFDLPDMELPDAMDLPDMPDLMDTPDMAGLTDSNPMAGPVSEPPLSDPAGGFVPSFGRLGSSSFDSLMDEVNQFNAECRELTAQGKAEIAANGPFDGTLSTPSAQPSPFHTGDGELDGILNDAS